MTKLKNPLFSFYAAGNISESVNFSKRGKISVVTKKPIPTNPHSLLQLYQRWLFEDYTYLWHQQTPAVKAQYRAAGVRYHLTAYQYWMKYHLTLYPDIVGLWRFDILFAGLSPDSSPYNHSAVVIGATSTPGIIGQGLSLDGLNDEVNLGNPAQLCNMTSKTMILFCRISPFTGSRRDLYYGSYYHSPYGDSIRLMDNQNTLEYRIRNTTDTYHRLPFNFTPDIPLVVAITWDGVNVRLFKDGDLAAGPHAIDGILSSTAHPLYLGRYSWNYHCACMVDNLIIFNRGLDATEVKRWSERRYPLI